MAGISRSALGAVVRWCAAGRDTASFGEGLFDRIGAAVSFDGAFLACVDPATLLYTHPFRRHMPSQASPAFIRTELGADDINQLRQLFRAASPVGWLDAATRGDRAASWRYREAMLPFDLGDELRVALRVDGQCWGVLCLHRGRAKAGFERRDAALLAQLAPHLALGLRRSLLFIDDPGWAHPAHGPGVAVVSADRTLRSVTAAAARWLDELAYLDQPRSPDLPTVVRAVIESLNVTVPEDALPVRARAQRLLAGLARKTIATELRISQHTVNDHIKAVFDKTGASSTGQLRAMIFQLHHNRPSSGQ